jgi:DNA-binding XRE family transcriptional regulator
LFKLKKIGFFVKIAPSDMLNGIELRKQELAVAARMRACRLAGNLTQEFVAFSIGVSTPTYCKIENGQLHIKLTHLWAIASVLNVSVGKLMD